METSESPTVQPDDSAAESQRENEVPVESPAIDESSLASSEIAQGGTQEGEENESSDKKPDVDTDQGRNEGMAVKTADQSHPCEIKTDVHSGVTDDSREKIKTNSPVEVSESEAVEYEAGGSEVKTAEPHSNLVQTAVAHDNSEVAAFNTINNQSYQTSSEEMDRNNSPYYLKWITWKDIRTPIVTQNDNGPCPLLAIINILLLRRAIELPSVQEMVTTQQLMEYLGDVVLKETPEDMAEGALRNFEQNMQDALSILPKLKTGLDVNVKFTGVADFEFTPECVIFDLLNIHLYHGWLVDPQSVEYKAAIGGLSYNQLVEKIVASKENNAESQLASDGLFAESFLQETANQLTYHGVCELNAKVKDDELCVFFRNNHFSTLYKHQGELFLLLTDQGFLTEDSMVWQTLSSVDGDGAFVDHNFKTLPMKDLPQPKPLSQEDQDYMLALSIQTEQHSQEQPETSFQATGEAGPSETPQHEAQVPEQGSDNALRDQELFDLQYAMQLQDEEEARARSQQARQPQRRTTRRQSPPPHSRGNVSEISPRESGGKNCVIL